MGCFSSKLKFLGLTNDKLNDKLNDKFDLFIKANCICDENKFVPINTLFTGFLFFIKNKYAIYYDNYRYSIRKQCIIDMCIDRGFELSSGYVDDFLDTRHIIGLSVAQFKEKKIENYITRS